MTNLTEQWKKGELPEGHYYVKDGENIIAEYLDGYFYSDGLPMTSLYGGVDEVLAKVPTYDEYQQLLSDQLAKNEGVEINAELEAENTKLKENIHSMLFTDDVVQDRYDTAKRENEELKLLVAEAWAYFKASLPCLYRHWIEKADKFLGEDK